MKIKLHNHQQQERINAIYAVLAHIPRGKVISYGELAKLAGMPKGARLVGQLMCKLPADTDLPWHRVVNAQGKISLPLDSTGYREQKRRLISDDIEFINEKINLAVYGYNS